MLRLCGRSLVFIRNFGREEALQVLELRDGSTRHQIRISFLQKAKIYHPDNQLTGDAEMFRKIKLANDILLGPKKYQPEVKKPKKYSKNHSQQNYHQNQHSDHDYRKGKTQYF